jgi:hypothetical protein
MSTFLLVSDHTGHNICGPDLSQGHLQGRGPRGEARLIVGLSKCSWLNLGASLARSCGVRTCGFQVSMRFMWLEEEVELLQSQGLLGLAL